MPSFENEDLVLSFNGEVIARVDVSKGNLTLGGQGRDGDLVIKDSDGATRIHMNGRKAQLFLGADGHDGNLILRNKEGRNTVFANGDPGKMQLGTNGQDGDLSVSDNRGRNTIRLNGQKGQLFLGSDGHDGNLILRDKEDRNTVFVNGDTGKMQLGTNGQDGDLSVSDNRGRNTIRLNGQKGQLFLGVDGHDGNLVVQDRNGQTTVFINGDAGDITLQNADFAEDFGVAAEADSVPGMVMRLGSDGRLEPCDVHADPRLVGVVSGAGGTRPGLVLDRQVGASGRAPIALMGKVGVLIDPDCPDLAAGDFLTSAALPGYATRADEDTPADAILGRMLRPHSPGMVVMLVRS